MVKRDFILSIIVGLGVFLTDYIFGWLTFLCGRIPVIFIIAVIIGFVAGTHGEAVFATMITWVGGILIGVLITPIVFAGTINPDQSLLGLFLFTFLYSVRGSWDITIEGNLIEVIVMASLALLVLMIVTPVLYLISFAFAPIGVVIGKFIRKLVGKRSETPSPMVQETQTIQSTPVIEEPVEANETRESEEEFSDNAEN